MVFTAIVYSGWQICSIRNREKQLKAITVYSTGSWDGADQVMYVPSNAVTMQDLKAGAEFKLLRLKRIDISHNDPTVNEGYFSLYPSETGTVPLSWPILTTGGSEFFGFDCDILVPMMNRSFAAYSLGYVYWNVVPTNAGITNVGYYFEVVE